MFLCIPQIDDLLKDSGCKDVSEFVTFLDSLSETMSTLKDDINKFKTTLTTVSKNYDELLQKHKYVAQQFAPSDGSGLPTQKDDEHTKRINDMIKAYAANIFDVGHLEEDETIEWDFAL